MTQRLVIFDVDGTLVDSQHSIVAAMTVAFEAQGLAVPDRGAILSIVGLSLDHAMLRLVPDLALDLRGRLVEGYRAAYKTHRLAQGAAHSPLFPGTLEMLEDLAARPGLVLGVATGKSRRGLDALIAAHGLERYFVTTQVADDHPSKPHPAMILAALEEADVLAADAVMVGDTSYDMEMASAAGVAGLGVSWGYHSPAALTAARRVIDRIADLPLALNQIWGDPT